MNIPSLDHCNNCPSILREYNSCPRAHVLESGNILEIILEFSWAFTSIFAYILFLIIVFYSFYQRTTRGFSLATLLGGQHVLCIILKEIYIETRPAGACATSFGFPSSHSSFVAALLSWLVIEALYFDKNSTFRKWKHYNSLRILSIPMFFMVPLARFFLNYHSFKQIFAGVALGIFCSIGYYFVIVRPVVHKKNITPLTPIVEWFWKLFGLKDNFTVEQPTESSKKAK